MRLRISSLYSTFSTLELLEDRRMLAPVVGVDFDTVATSPTNWRTMTDFGQTELDIPLDDGTATSIDLTTTFIGNRNNFSNSAGIGTIPQHIPTLDPGILGYVGDAFGSDTVNAVWSDLTPSTKYRVFVFATTLNSPGLNQVVTIAGDGSDDPAPFVQSVGNNTLIINGELGDASRDLGTYGLEVTSTAAGTITVDIEGDSNIFLAGLAIQEVAGNPQPGVAVIGSAISVNESGQTATYQVALNTSPAGPVTVTVAADGQSELSTGGDFATSQVLVFNSTAPQTITVRGNADLTFEGNHTSTITHTVTASGDNTNYPIGLAGNDFVIDINDLPPVVGVDFDVAASTSFPLHWALLTDIGQSSSDIPLDDGTATSIDVTTSLVGTGNTVQRNHGGGPLPQHFQPLSPGIAGTAGKFFAQSTDALQAVWSDLRPNAKYRVYVFATTLVGGSGGGLNQTTSITGDGTNDPTPFSQTSGTGVMWVNGQALMSGDDALLLPDLGLEVTSSNAGTVTISTSPNAQPQHIFWSGLAIEEINEPPVITSAPVTTATVGQPYTYVASGTDPNPNDVLTLSLDTAPTGMTINPSTGLIQWTPTLAQVGNNDVVVRIVDDGAPQLSATQSFTIVVPANVTIVGDDLVITDIDNRQDTLTLQTNGIDVILTDPSNILTTAIPGATGNGTNTITVPLSAFSGDIIVNTEGNDDSLTVDFGLGAFTRAITYNAGETNETNGDSVEITGYNATTAELTNTGAESGEISVDGGPLITFSETEPLTLSGTAADLIFTLSDASANTATLSDDGPGTTDPDATQDANFSYIQFGAGGEDTEFLNPTNSLTVNLGDAGDMLQVNTLDANYAASLIINGGAATTDNVQLNSVALVNTPGRGLHVTETETLGITGGTISGNAATTGGGILIDNATGGTSTTATITGTTISGNSATTSGGGIHVNGAANVTLDDARVLNNQATGDGGGLRNSGTLTIQNNTLVDGNNTTGTNNEGGGIYNSGGGSVMIDSSIVSNNFTAGNNSEGGGIFNLVGSVSLNLSTLSGNSTTVVNSEGGGIFTVNGSLTLTDSTVDGNSTVGNNGEGGGIFNQNSAISITRSTISNNFTLGIGSDGGGIYSDTELASLIGVISNSTISGNSSGADGGGIYNFDGLLRIRNSTVTNNIATGLGEGVASFGDNVTSTEVVSTIISANGGTDVDFVEMPANSFASLGNNLIGTGNATAAFVQTGDMTGVTNPGVEPLANNGGPTQTHALQTASLAIDGGANPDALATDQRGEPRILGPTADIGAFEAIGLRDIVASVVPTTINEGDSVVLSGSFTSHFQSHTVTIDWGDSESDTISLPAGTLNFSQSHTYVDDDPTGTASDVNPILITVEAVDGATTSDNSAAVTVNNLPPELTSLTLNPPNVPFGGTTTQIVGSYTDTGVDDTHMLDVDTDGDGTFDVTNVLVTGGSFTFNVALNPSRPPGVYDVGVRLRDDDLGSVSDVLQLTVEPPHFVLDAYVFYNDSAYDGNGTFVASADFNAIDFSINPLEFGGTASIENISGFTKGLTGFMLDIGNVPNDGANLSAADFSLSVGNDNFPDTWAAGPNVSITVFANQGAAGTDRIAVVPSTPITNSWTRLTVQGNSNTGLSQNYDGFFASALGETGINIVPGLINVNAFDIQNTVQNVSMASEIGNEPVTQRADVNKSKTVDALDFQGVILNIGIDVVDLITPVPGSPGVATDLAQALAAPRPNSRLFPLAVAKDVAFGQAGKQPTDGRTGKSLASDLDSSFKLSNQQLNRLQLDQTQVADESDERDLVFATFNGGEQEVLQNGWTSL